MNLIDFCKANGGTATLSCPVLTKLAAEIECSPGTLYQIALGNKSAGPNLANAIHRVTGGAVTRHDLRPDIFGPVPELANAA